MIEPPRQLVKKEDGHFEIPAWRLEELEKEARQEAAILRAMEFRSTEDQDLINDTLSASA